MSKPRVNARIEARIQERAAYCVEFELKDPRAAFITVTRVEVSDDLSSARIFYSVYGTEADRTRVAHMLEDAGGFIRKQVGRVLRTRRVPHMRWVYDDSIEYSANMERTISEALQRDRQVNPQAHPELELEAGSDDPGQLDQEYRDFLQAQEDEE